MANLTLGLLGPLQVTLAGSPVNSFESDKARALLAYLAIRTDRPHRRESLAGLFWPDLPERSARQNLRRTPYGARRSIRDHRAKTSVLARQARTEPVQPVERLRT